MEKFNFSYFLGESGTFDKAPIPIAVSDANNRTIAYVNEPFSAILGRPKDELVGMSWADVTHPEDLSLSDDRLKPFREGLVNQVQFDKRYLRPDGKSVWVSLSFFRSTDARKKRYHVLIATNIDERRQKKMLLDELNHDLDKAREAIMNSMAILSEFRDRETGEHIARTRLYMKLILDRMPYSLPYSHKAINLIANSAVLHDIGKVGIPDHILLKPDKLTHDEFEIMKTHTVLGADAIVRTQRTMEKDTFLMFAKEIAEFHHERWDGTGYPVGLKGDEIPLTARAMALADVYDALRSDRPYKAPYSHEESIAIIRDGAGTQFDPTLASVFLSNEREIFRISSTAKEELDREFRRDPEAAYA